MQSISMGDSIVTQFCVFDSGDGLRKKQWSRFIHKELKDHKGNQVVFDI